MKHSDKQLKNFNYNVQQPKTTKPQEYETSTMHGLQSPKSLLHTLSLSAPSYNKNIVICKLLIELLFPCPFSLFNKNGVQNVTIKMQFLMFC